MKPHQKHPPLARPHRGAFAPHELAILGAPCDLIRSVAETYISAHANATIAFVDASHSKSAAPVPVGIQWMDNQDHAAIATPVNHNPWQRRIAFQGCNAVLINGNHFEATAQIAIVHPKKLDSLERRLEQLSNVIAVVLCEGITEWPSFLKQKVATDTPTVNITDISKLHGILDAHLLAAPPVVGLVLAGGKSTRMGEDKGLMEFNGKPQRTWLTEQLREVCSDVLVSCRPDQVAQIAPWATPLPDRLVDFGPYGALMTAFMHRADCAYFVVACDMPEFDREAMDFLLSHRDAFATATAFRKSADAFPEPLCTIWEPQSYGGLTSFMSQGNSCPRKFLINSKIRQITSPNPLWLKNVNSKEDIGTRP